MLTQTFCTREFRLLSGVSPSLLKRLCARKAIAYQYCGRGNSCLFPKRELFCCAILVLSREFYSPQESFTIYHRLRAVLTARTVILSPYDYYLLNPELEFTMRYGRLRLLDDWQVHKCALAFSGPKENLRLVVSKEHPPQAINPANNCQFIIYLKGIYEYLRYQSENHRVGGEKLDEYFPEFV